MANDTNMGLAVFIHQMYRRIHPLLDNLEAGMIGMNNGMVGPTLLSSLIH